MSGRRNTWKTILLLLFVASCGVKQTPAQEPANAQQDAIRRLETRMDELRSQMTQIQSELDAIRGTKVPETGSITSTLPPP